MHLKFTDVIVAVVVWLSKQHFCVCVCLLKVKLFESVKLFIIIINLVFAMYCPHITYVSIFVNMYNTILFLYPHKNFSLPCAEFVFFLILSDSLLSQTPVVPCRAHRVWMNVPQECIYIQMYMCVSRWQPCITRCFRCCCCCVDCIVVQFIPYLYFYLCLYLYRQRLTTTLITQLPVPVPVPLPG